MTSAHTSPIATLTAQSVFNQLGNSVIEKRAAAVRLRLVIRTAREADAKIGWVSVGILAAVEFSSMPFNLGSDLSVVQSSHESHSTHNDTQQRRLEKSREEIAQVA